jgi:gamma-glutamyltranspeptidase
VISLQVMLSELVNHPRLALGILDEMEKEGKIAKLLEMEHNSVEYLHTVIEALRLSFADTRYAPSRETPRRQSALLTTAVARSQVLHCRPGEGPCTRRRAPK